MQNQAAFYIGQLVKHALFEYRGVVVDADPQFMLSDEWYELMAKSRPSKDEPWYRVLVDEASHETYVAEQNLRACNMKNPIQHPELNDYFSDFENGHYILDKNYTN